MSHIAAARVDPLVKAAEVARFFFHCHLMHPQDNRALRDPSGEGEEIAAEALQGLQEALRVYYHPDPPPPICSGCSPIKGIEDVNGED